MNQKQKLINAVLITGLNIIPLTAATIIQELEWQDNPPVGEIEGIPIFVPLIPLMLAGLMLGATISFGLRVAKVKNPQMHLNAYIATSTVFAIITAISIVKRG